MTISEELEWRGFVAQSTLTDLAKLNTDKRKFYLGFDASADSQTIGNLALMMFARLFLRHGFEGVLLAGGSTSLIGDPGGKDKERPMQSEATVVHNVANAERELQRVLGGYDFKLVNNLDWTRDMSVLTFLRNIGKHYSMTNLVQRDYIANRMGEGGAGISYTEFSYTLLQGMDYLHLFDTEGVTLQFGGSDQWGNCISGVDLVRRARGAEVDVISINLVINQATGKKFGKSEAGAVWLDPAKTSPTEFYQFWINCDDIGVENYLKIYSELDKTTIDDILADHRAQPARRIAQTALAQAVTTLVHGQLNMEAAETVTAILTGTKPLESANDTTLQVLRAETTTVSVQDRASILQTLVDGGLATSVSEARRLLQGNAIAIDGQKIDREQFTADDFIAGRLLLRKGKKFRDTILVELA